MDGSGRRRWPSLTALIVACARGAGDVDRVAERFVPAPLGAALRLARLAGRKTAVVDRFVTASSFGLVEHLVGRTHAIDEVVDQAAAAGVSQVVVLGAGLDARAWRLPALARCRVFEVDHPATQAYKRDKSSFIRPFARDVVFVPVDFERGLADESLETAGHDAAIRTAWLWEGVTPYLTPEATRQTLEMVARRSAPGSVVAMTYGMPELARGGMNALKGPVGHVFERAVRGTLDAIGEPLAGLMSPGEAEELLLLHGFVLRHDTGSEDWQHRVPARQRSPLPVVVAERLAVAVKRGVSSLS